MSPTHPCRDNVFVIQLEPWQHLTDHFGLVLQMSAPLLATRLVCCSWGWDIGYGLIRDILLGTGRAIGFARTKNMRAQVMRCEALTELP